MNNIIKNILYLLPLLEKHHSSLFDSYAALSHSILSIEIHKTFSLTVLGQLGKPHSGTEVNSQRPNQLDHKVSANPVTVTNDLKIGSCPLAILKI